MDFIFSLIKKGRLNLQHIFSTYFGRQPGFPFIVVLFRLFFCKQYVGFLRQPPPANNKINRNFNKLTLQSLPQVFHSNKTYPRFKRPLRFKHPLRFKRPRLKISRLKFKIHFYKLFKFPFQASTTIQASTLETYNHPTPLTTFTIIFFLLLTPTPSFTQQNTPGLILNDETSRLENKKIVNFLPFFNKQFEKKGHSSPLTFGVGLSGLAYQQEFISTNLKIVGTTNLGQDIFARGDSVSQQTTAAELKAYIKPNIWILPFLNVYGIIGYTSGQINPDLYIDGIIIEDLPGIGDYLIDTSFVLNDKIVYHGSTYGFGTTFSMGFNKLILLLDYHYTVTNPSELDGKLYNHFASTKLGWMINANTEKLKLIIWTGALYISNNQSFKGEITVEEIAPELVPVFGEKADYYGNIEAKNNWNALIGASLSINNHHNIFVEFGFINRQQATIGYGFMF